MKTIDVNAVHGHWPIQRTSFKLLRELEEEYARLNIGEVWLSAAESILAPEPDEADLRLFEQLGDYPRFRPVKTVNPLLGNWKVKLYQAHEQWPLAAIKIYPLFHGYTMKDACCDELMKEAADLGLPVLVQIRVNDERNQPFFMEVPPVNVVELAECSLKHPATTMIALSAYLYELPPLQRGSERLLADFSFLDSVKLIEKVETVFPLSRLVFGTAVVWMVPEAARLKLQFSKASPEKLEAITSGNLCRLGF